MGFASALCSLMLCFLLFLYVWLFKHALMLFPTEQQYSLLDLTLFVKQITFPLLRFPHALQVL